MDAHSNLLQRCFQDAAASARGALERSIDEALASLQAAEDGAIKLVERDSLTMARVGLLQQRGIWGPQYETRLLAAFGTVTSDGSELSDPVTPSVFAAMGGSTSGYATLSLVDDAQITQDIEFARLSQQLRLHVDPVMADLDALVCAAMGLTRVQPERNGLRPEVFADSLRGVLNGANVPPDIRALWLKGLSTPMGQELRAIYETLIAQLLGANVQAVSYRLTSYPSSSVGFGADGAGGGAGRGGGAGAAGGGAGRGGGAGAAGGEGRGGAAGGAGGGWGSRSGPGADDTQDPGGDWFDGESGGMPAVDPLSGSPTHWADLSPSGVNETLFRDFLVEGADNRARLADSYYARVDGELEALRAEPEPAVDSQQGELADGAPPGYRPSRRLDGQSLLSSQVWGEYARYRARKLVHVGLKKEATQVRQVMGLEVVRKLVNEVAQDPRLLVPVRESIVALEPSLARLAMVDPRFFSDETHPGRRLMERVAQRSFKYIDADSVEFLEFFESVRRSFNALNEQDIDSAQPFNNALATLENAWTERDREEEARSHEALHGLRFAEERQALADQIAYDMSSRPDLDMVPGPVLDFLFGPWSLVMAHARLVDQDNQIDPRGLGLVVSDLVWSVKRDFTLRQPAKLMDMIPGMVRKLNAGLDLIGHDPGSRKAFLDILMRLHGPVLKLRRLKSERDAQDSSALPLEDDLLPATAEQRVPRAAAQPWLAPQEQNDAGFEDTLSTGPAELEGQPVSVDGALAPAPAGETATGPNRELAGDTRKTPGQDPEQVEHILMGLHTGCWVDLFSRQRWRRAQLVWSSAKGTLFMFVSHGGRPHSMTRRSCERLIVHDLLRTVETHGVVERALESIKNAAKAEDAGHASAPRTARGQALPA